MPPTMAGISSCPREGPRDGWEMGLRLGLSVSQDHQSEQPEAEAHLNVSSRKDIRCPLEK